MQTFFSQIRWVLLPSDKLGSDSNCRFGRREGSGGGARGKSAPAWQPHQERSLQGPQARQDQPHRRRRAGGAASAPRGCHATQLPSRLGVRLGPIIALTFGEPGEGSWTLAALGVTLGLLWGHICPEPSHSKCPFGHYRPLSFCDCDLSSGSQHPGSGCGPEL